MNKLLLTAARTAACYGLFAVLGAGRLAAEDAKKTDDKGDNEPQKLEKFEVTGSRIQRLDAEGPQPVVTFTPQDIEARGFSTLGDFVQSLPFNSSSVDSIIQTASFTRGATTVNPRGLGHGRFLVLINGRRAVSYALTDSNNRSVFDFNTIPTEAIDSIEYLKDGASAIYGSDAVTGVMNIKLKKAYSGITTTLYAGDTIGHDTFTRSANILVGADSRKTSVMVDVNWYKQNSNFIKDYDRSKTTDYTYLGVVKGANQNSTNNYPANVNFTAAQATAAGLGTGAGVYAITGGNPTANPTKSAFTYFATATLLPNADRYDFAQTYQLVPDHDYTNLFASFRHELNDNLSAFGQIVYSDNNTYYSFTPAVISTTSTPTNIPYNNAPVAASYAITLPANNPYNPFGIAVPNFLYRTNFGPPRKFDVQSDSASFLAGLRGKLGGNWTWESGFNYGYSLVTSVARNAIKADDLQTAFNGTTRATALNPFGPSDNQSVVDKLFTISNSSAKDTSYSFDFSATGSLLHMPALLGQSSAGDLGAAVGGEWREEKLDGRPDTTSYVGSGGGTPYVGKRTVQSEFLEIDVPVIRKYLELQLAVRHEHYSDFGNTTKPKFSFVSQPFSFFKLRGSFSESFKAPDLGQLYTARTTAFTSTNVADPLRPQDPSTQLRIITGGNPNLKPENGKIWYGGTVFDLGKAVKGLSLSVDYFNFDIRNIITSYTTPATIFAYFPDRVIRDSTQGNPGPIQYIEATPNNVASYFYRGFDLGLDYQLKKTRTGDWGFGIQATRITYYGQNSGLATTPTNYVGRWNQPRWTANAQTTWRYRDFGASLAALYKGPYLNDLSTYAVVSSWGENPIAKLNATVSYSGFRGYRVTLSCDNVLDQQPPPNGRETSSFDQSTYYQWAMGRFVSIRVKKEF